MQDTPKERTAAGPAWKTKLAPGLYFVATPIGSARDITLRALDILASADVLAAEDTRTARKLMEIHGVALGDRQLIAYHDHNGPAQRPRLLRALAEGKSVAYVSEAGTPLVADPGFPLGRAALEAGAQVFAAPGASAVLAALTVSGLPSDRFLFAGFPPPAAGARKTWLAELAQVQATIILYESPKRINRLLTDVVAVCGGDRQIAVCRELTKRFEEVLRGPAADVLALLEGRSLKGEVVVVIDRGGPVAVDDETVEDALRDALKTMRVKEASNMVADRLDLPRRDVYQRALALGRDD